MPADENLHFSATGKWIRQSLKEPVMIATNAHGSVEGRRMWAPQSPKVVIVRKGNG